MPKRKDRNTGTPVIDVEDLSPTPASIIVNPGPVITVSPAPPAAPTNLQAAAEDANVRLTWQDQSGNEEGFNIRRMGPTDTDFQNIATVGPNIATFLDTTVQPNTAYTYRVRAFIGDSGAGSNTATITTPPAVAAPSNLRALAGDGRVELTWQDNSFNEDGFKVKRKGPGDLDFIDIATIGINVTSFNDVQIQPNTTYTYRVRAFRNSGGGNASNDATVTTAPLVAAPSNLRAMATEGRVELTWQDNSNNEDGFKIKRRGPGEPDFVDIATVGLNVTSFNDIQFQPNTTYTYRVRAFRNSGGGSVSNDAMVTTLALVAAPSNLRATAVEGRVELTWQDNSNNEDGFLVKRKKSTDVDFVDIGMVGANFTSFNDTQFQPSTTYIYRVRAFRNAGGGAVSNDAMVTTLALVAAPSNLRAMAAEGRVELTWQDNSNNEDGFIVKRKKSTDADFVDIGTVGANVTSFNDTQFQPSTTYTYRVRAFRNSGGGAVSNDATVTTLAVVAAPSNLRAMAAEGRVELTWQDNSNNEDGFMIRRKKSTDADFIDIATVGANVTSFNDTQFQPSTTYTYRVRAFRNAGGGAMSNDATVTTLAVVAAPSNLRATAAEGRVELTWQDNSNNEDGFLVKRKGPGDLDFVDIGAVGVNVTSFNDMQFQPNTTYTYRVRSFRNSGGGAASNDVTVTTLALVAAPSNLQATAAPGRVDLTWQDNSNNEDGFIVKRKKPADLDFVDIGTVGVNVTSFSDTQVQPNTTYTYRVRSFRNAGGGAASNDATVTTPAVQLPAPRITSVEPGFGPLPGGTPITVKGEHFVSGCQLKIGGENAMPVTFVNDKTLTANTPPQMDPGRKNVRVTNPDGQSFVLNDAFEYINPPMIQSVSPSALPAERQPGEPPPLVSVVGAFFQPGAVVLFGQKTANVRNVSADGMTIDVDLPESERGTVGVTVRNPDLQQAVLPNAFTYLGPNQAARPRINEITPLTILAGANTPVTLKGLNLKKAFDQGRIMVLGPAEPVAFIELTEGQATTDMERREDTVTFKLKVTVPGGLGLGEQITLMITPSLRPDAADDLLLEGKTAFLSVISSDLPVPLGFTARLVNGQNLVMMAGRNMNTAKLEVWQGDTRLEMSEQFATDQYVVGSLNLNTESGAPLRLRLLDAARSDAELSTYPLTLDTPDISPLAPAGNADLDPNVGRVELQPAGDRTLITSPDGRVSAVDVRTGVRIASTIPQINSPHLRSGAGLQLTTINIERTLFEGAFLLPGFARPQEGVIQFTPLNVRVGKIFSIQALTLLLAVEVKFVLQIRVAVVPVFDPFGDFLPLEPFNDFTNELPPPFSGFPGAFALQVSLSFGVALGFFLGLIQPKRPGDAEERVQLLLAAGIGVGVNNGRFELEAGIAYSARIAGVRPLGGSNNGKLLHLAASQPVIDEAGFRGYYFATDSGRACVPFEFDATLIKTFRSGAPEVRSRLLAQFKVCTDINENDNLSDFFIEPSPLSLPSGGQATLIAKDQDGNRLAVPERIKFELVPGAPPLVTVADQDAMDNALVIAGTGVSGETQIRALVSTAGSGFGLLPSLDLGFEIDRFVSQGQLPRAEAQGKRVKATVEAEAGTVEFDSLILPRQFNVSTGDVGDKVRAFEIRFKLKPGSQKDFVFDFVVEDLKTNAGGTAAASLTIPSVSVSAEIGVEKRVQVKVQAGPSGSSGVFFVRPRVKGRTFEQKTIVVVPPQILLRILRGEYSTVEGAFTYYNSPSMKTSPRVLIGMTLANRFPESDLPTFGRVTTFQRIADLGQAALSSEPTGGGAVSADGRFYELDAAADAFFALDDLTHGCQNYWSPRPEQWAIIQRLMMPGETVEGCPRSAAELTSEIPTIGGRTGIPLFYGAPPSDFANTVGGCDGDSKTGTAKYFEPRGTQIVCFSNMPENVAYPKTGTPAFIFLRRRNTSEPPVVVDPAGLPPDPSRPGASITKVTPTSGAEGKEIVLSGTSLVGVTKVRFNGVEALFTAGPNDSIKAIVPAGATNGTIRVTTAFNGTISGPGTFRLEAAVASVTPAMGPAGTQLKIVGTTLTGASAVRFPLDDKGQRLVSATPVVVSDTELTVVVPKDAVTGLLRVTTPAGTPTANFTVTPSTASVELTTQPTARTHRAGENAVYTITLARKNYRPPVMLSVSGLPAGASPSFSENPVTGNTSTLTFAVPANTPRGKSVFVIRGTAPNAEVAPAAASLTVDVTPAITDVAPTTGPAGTLVSIAGVGFTGVTNVRFGNTEARFSVNPPRFITAVVPPTTTTGTVTVVTRNGTATTTVTSSAPPTVAPPDPIPPAAVSVSLSASSIAPTVPGAVTSCSIDIARSNYLNPITLQVQGLPVGAKASFAPNPVSGAGSVLSIATSAVTPPGVYLLILSASGPEITIAPITIRLEVVLQRTNPRMPIIPGEPLEPPFEGS
jgi:uncharacterized protein